MELPKLLPFLIALAIGLAMILLKRRLAKPFLWMSFYLLSLGMTQTLANLLVRIGSENWFFYNWVLVIHCILAYLFLRSLSPAHSYRTLLGYVFLIGSLGFIMLLALAVSSGNFASKALTLLNLIIIIGCFLYLHQLLDDVDNKVIPILRGVFWLATGFMFQHLASLSHWLFFDVYVDIIPTNVFRFLNLAPDYILYLLSFIAIGVELGYSQKSGVYDE